MDQVLPSCLKNIFLVIRSKLLINAGNRVILSICGIKFYKLFKSDRIICIFIK